MKAIKATLEDYLFDFRLKSRREKIRAIRKFGFQMLFVLLLICSPAIISKIDGDLEKDLRSRVMPELTTEQKWSLVRQGRMKIECVDDIDEKLQQAGMNPNSSEATEYAIEHDMCSFALNQ